MTPAQGGQVSTPAVGRLRSLAPTLGALAFQSALVATIYWPTLNLAFVSDAWVYLERLRQGLWPAVATPVGYHWQPVGCAWIALIRGIFGERPGVFQAISLAQLILLGHLAFQLGRRLLPDSGVAFLGSLLVLGSAAFYEATYWPLAGNMHLLAADLYLISVILACDVGHGRLPRSGPWLLAVTAAAAVFSHPAMVTVVPVCAVTLVLMGRGGPQAGSSRAPVRWPALVPLGVVGGLFLLARAFFHAYLVQAPTPTLDPTRAFWLVRRGLVGVFSLRAAEDVVDRLMDLGTRLAYGTGLMWVAIAAWLVVAAAAAVLAWRARSPALRVLVAFLGIHLVAVSVASPFTSRQALVPAVPAALLTAWALRSVAEWLAVRVAASRPGAALWRELPAAAVLLMIVNAQTDHHLAAQLNGRAADASRALVDAIRIVTPPERGPVDLTLVNMPSHLSDRGMGAFLFANGLGELAHLTSSTVGTVDLRNMPTRDAPDNVISELPILSPSALRMQLADPYRAVLLFGKEPFAVRVLTPADADRLSAP